MTLTFKDSNGVEWLVLVEHNVDHRCPLKRFATQTDLFAALGQLSTGSLALGEQKQAARVSELEALNSQLTRDYNARLLELTKAESELAATKANYAALHELHELTCKQSDAFAAETAATKAKLADVERERDGLRESAKRAWSKACDINTERNAFEDEALKLRSELASARRHMGLLCDRLRFEVSDHKTPCPCSSCVFVESAEQALATAVPAAPDPRDTELERLRGVVEAAKHWASLDHDDGATYRECVEASKKLQAAAEALASAGTDADSRKEDINDVSDSREPG